MQIVICVFSRQNVQQLLIRLWHGKQNDTSVSICFSLDFVVLAFLCLLLLPWCASKCTFLVLHIAAFMLCHCTWIALFSFHIDYRRKVHMHCLFANDDNEGETDRRRKKYDMTSGEWANKSAITDEISEKAYDEIVVEENRTKRANSNNIGQTKEALNTFKDLQRRQSREANKHASSVHWAHINLTYSNAVHCCLLNLIKFGVRWRMGARGAQILWRKEGREARCRRCIWAKNSKFMYTTMMYYIKICFFSSLVMFNAFRRFACATNVNFFFLP